jgi:hypothetical protein
MCACRASLWSAAVRLVVLHALVRLTAQVGSAQSARPLRPFPALFGPTELDLKTTGTAGCELPDRYEFASAEGLPALLTTGMNRQGARMGLTLWTSLAR